MRKIKQKLVFEYRNLLEQCEKIRMVKVQLVSLETTIFREPFYSRERISLDLKNGTYSLFWFYKRSKFQTISNFKVFLQTPKNKIFRKSSQPKKLKESRIMRGHDYLLNHFP